MGTVNFVTDVNKTVDINKLVNLNVNKDVTVDVDISGRLATAEASADAIGGGTGTGGREIFVIDDFDGSGGDFPDIDPEPSRSSVVTDFVADGTPVSGGTDIDDTDLDGLDGTGPCKPQGNDGPNWVMGAPGGAAGWTRDIEANLASIDEMQTEICYACDAGHLVSGAGGSSGTSSFIYGGPAIDVLGDLGCDDIEQLCFEYAADLDGAEIVFTFGGGGAEIVLSTADLFPDGLENTNGSSNVEELVEVCLDVDDPNEQLVFSALDSVRIDIIGDEVPDLDLTLDCVELVCVSTGGGNLAETDTFAQVTDEGAFSFSESLAATSGEADLVIT